MNKCSTFYINISTKACLAQKVSCTHNFVLALADLSVYDTTPLLVSYFSGLYNNAKCSIYLLSTFI